VFGATGPLAAKIAGLTATAEAAYEQYLVINDLMQELADSFLIGAALGYSIGLVCGAYALLLTLAQYKILVKKIKRDAIVRLFTVRPLPFPPSSPTPLVCSLSSRSTRISLTLQYFKKWRCVRGY
jgi:hypothetical protein